MRQGHGRQEQGSAPGETEGDSRFNCGRHTAAAPVLQSSVNVLSYGRGDDLRSQTERRKKYAKEFYMERGKGRGGREGGTKCYPR